VKRRLFVQAGVSSLLIPNAMLAASVQMQGGEEFASSYFFFDERFTEARRLARAFSGTNDPIPVHSDITALWTGQLKRASRAAPMIIKGVTTESFFFCLKILLADQARVDAQVRRIDQDLHLWTMRSHHHHHIKHGTVSWQNHSHQV
jgi:hypothetical protein